MSHDRPVLQGPAILVLVQSLDFLIDKKTPSALGDMVEHGRVKLVLRKKVVFAIVAAQEITLLGSPEPKRGARASLGAVNNHVGEVGVFVVGLRFGLAEDTAGWERSQDSADDQACGVELKIASVVLYKRLAKFDE